MEMSLMLQESVEDKVSLISVNSNTICYTQYTSLTHVNTLLSIELVKLDYSKEVTT